MEEYSYFTVYQPENEIMKMVLRGVIWDQLVHLVELGHYN